MYSCTRKKCTYTKHKIYVWFGSKPHATCMYWTSFFLSVPISSSPTPLRFPDFRLCLSLGNRSVTKNLLDKSSLKSSRPCASSPLPPSISSTASPPSETQRYLFTKGKKLKNQISYHPNHLCSLSAADSVSSTTSPESSTYAVKVSPAGYRLLFLSNRVSRFTLRNWCLSKGKGESN